MNTHITTLVSAQHGVDSGVQVRQGQGGGGQDFVGIEQRPG